jgi:hypothetical protein
MKQQRRPNVHSRCVKHCFDRLMRTVHPIRCERRAAYADDALLSSRQQQHACRRASAYKSAANGCQQPTAYAMALLVMAHECPLQVLLLLEAVHRSCLLLYHYTCVSHN